jgi:gluconate 2-dehydrogenase gamma chain
MARETSRNGLDRRRLLTGLALAAPASAATADVIRGEVAWSGKTDAPQGVDRKRSYVFFNPAEAAFVESACARIIPNDELGPGAVEAGVPEFIDRQLNGPFGRAERWYMQGPWSKGTDSQGYQSRMNPAGVYRAAIRAIDNKVASQGGQTFAKLQPAAQDDWLHRLEDGKADLEGVDAKTFFDLFLQNVQEGFWSDPIYGGNRDMAGWRLIGFPGARYDRRDWVLRHNEPYPLPPVGIGGRKAWNKGG